MSLKTAVPVVGSYLHVMKEFLEKRRTDLCETLQFYLVEAIQLPQAKKAVKYAKASDQYRTPAWVIDLITTRLHIHKEELYDLCEFNENWSEASHFNFFTAKWPKYRICFLNPPYSQTSAAIYKAMLEFCLGKNVVLLVKYTSAVEAAK